MMKLKLIGAAMAAITMAPVVGAVEQGDGTDPTKVGGPTLSEQVLEIPEGDLNVLFTGEQDAKKRKVILQLQCMKILQDPKNNFDQQKIENNLTPLTEELAKEGNKETLQQILQQWKSMKEKNDQTVDPETTKDENAHQL